MYKICNNSVLNSLSIINTLCSWKMSELLPILSSLSFYVCVYIYTYVCIFIGTNTGTEVYLERVCQCCWLCKREQSFWNGDGKKQRRRALALGPQEQLRSVCCLLCSCPGVHLPSPTGLEDRWGGWFPKTHRGRTIGQLKAGRQWAWHQSKSKAGCFGCPQFRSDSSRQMQAKEIV